MHIENLMKWSFLRDGYEIKNMSGNFVSLIQWRPITNLAVEANKHETVKFCWYVGSGSQGVLAT